MGTFLAVWAGQLVSIVGSNLTRFALAIFVFRETGSATQLAGILLAAELPSILFTPIAGALVDRWDRRLTMILADTGAGVATLTVAALLATDSLELWHLYPILAVSALFQSFQWPAYSAATTMLVDKSDYTRAAGLVQFADAVGQVLAPVLAGALLVAGGLTTIVVIDVVTFLIAVATLLAVRFPSPPESQEASDAAGSLWSEARFGFSYLRQRHGLLVLLFYFAALNLVLGFLGLSMFPLILGLAGEAALGTVVSLSALGMIAGSLLMSAWKNPSNLVRNLILSMTAMGAAMILVGARPSLILITVASFVVYFAVPVGNGFSQALWQRKVHPDVQGRVFAVRRTIGHSTGPIALVLAGPAIDRLFEPALQPGGSLADTVGAIVGTGPGRGAAALVAILGVVTILISIAAYSYAPLAKLESEIPDAV